MDRSPTSRTERDDRVRAEASALWREFFVDPPPPDVDGPTLLELITRRLPETCYRRLTTPHLRPNEVAMPKDRPIRAP